MLENTPFEGAFRGKGTALLQFEGHELGLMGFVNEHKEEGVLGGF